MESHNALRDSGVDDPLFETLRLFDLLSEGALRKESLSVLRSEHGDLQDLIEKRKKGVPWEYILGKAIFMGHKFHCSSATFLPTEETRLLVDAVLNFIKNAERAGNRLTLLEIGTGCGNLSVMVGLNSKYLRILTSDINAAATKIAEKNVQQYNLQDRISLFSGDLFSPFESSEYKENIDVIMCDPPYIPTGSLSKMPREIIDYEPRVALDGGPYGIDFFRRLIVESRTMLKSGGLLCFEIGERQEKLVTRLFEKNEGYMDIQYLMDGSKVRAMSALKK